MNLLSARRQIFGLSGLQLTIVKNSRTILDIEHIVGHTTNCVHLMKIYDKSTDVPVKYVTRSHSSSSRNRAFMQNTLIPFKHVTLITWPVHNNVSVTCA